MVGKHLIANVNNISSHKCLEKVETIQLLMKEIIEKCNLNVVGELHHQFEPIGATLLYLLAESHLSVHTFPEGHYCTIDLYHCSNNVDFDKALDIIYNFFNGDCIIIKHIIER